MFREALARILEPRSYCSGCGYIWFSDKRKPCPRCKSTARSFTRSVTDHIDTDDRVA